MSNVRVEFTVSGSAVDLINDASVEPGELERLDSEVRDWLNRELGQLIRFYFAEDMGNRVEFHVTDVRHSMVEEVAA